MRLMVKSESIATPRVELTELVRMAQQEDRSAFEEIVRRTTGLARKTAFGVVRPHQVDDVVQEAFLTVYQKLHHLRDPRRDRGFRVAPPRTPDQRDGLPVSSGWPGGVLAA